MTASSEPARPDPAHLRARLQRLHRQQQRRPALPTHQQIALAGEAEAIETILRRADRRRDTGGTQ